MKVTELIGQEPNSARVNAIKRLRKGQGLLGAGSKVDLALFEVNDSEEFSNTINLAGHLMPPWRATDAIFNALNLGLDLAETEDLTERRELFAAKHAVSMRTVMRLEEEGAILLDYWIGRIAASRAEASWITSMTFLMASWLWKNAEVIGIDSALADAAAAATYEVSMETARLAVERVGDTP